MSLVDPVARKAYQHEWYMKNQERLVARQRALYLRQVKAHRNAVAKAWRDQNSEYVREMMRIKRRKYNAQRTAYNRKWRTENREHVRARDNSYNEKMREHQREMSRKRYARDPHAHIMRQHKRRVTKLKAQGTCSKEQLAARFAFHGNRCVYCKCDGKMEADHMIPLTRNGTNWPSNFVPACVRCNRRKSRSTYFEFMRRSDR